MQDTAAVLQVVPWQHARLEYLETRGSRGGVPLYAVTHLRHTEDANLVWESLGPLLAAMERGETGRRIARLEFIWDRHTGRRGVVMYDTDGSPVIHVANALLGYSGAGPALSGQIMEALGVLPEVFEMINSSVTNQDYIVVLSREKWSPTVSIRHRKAVTLPTEMDGAWSYFRIYV